jgi:hypothetical protein
VRRELAFVVFISRFFLSMMVLFFCSLFLLSLLSNFEFSGTTTNSLSLSLSLSLFFHRAFVLLNLCSRGTTTKTNQTVNESLRTLASLAGVDFFSSEMCDRVIELCRLNVSPVAIVSVLKSLSAVHRKKTTPRESM